MLLGACAMLATPLVSQADDSRLGHKPTAWEHAGSAKQKRAVMSFGDSYRAFISRYKTEREVVSAAKEMARKRGFRDLLANKRPALRPGTKVYAESHGKLLALVVVGKRPLSQGVHIVAAHADAVRIDLKQNPLYADGNAAWLQTQYYGGIKSYQWLSLPLELRGVVAKKDGTILPISIGDDPKDPVLIIPDIAVHISHRVDAKEGEQVPGEALDPILSSTPMASPPAGTDPFAAEAERLLKTRYGVDVHDLLAAELELVPAATPRDVGIDRALIGGYGQDDRACSYAALRALLDVSAPQHTAIVMLVDREETGSNGNTGAKSNFVRRLVAELVEGMSGTSTQIVIDRIMAASMVMSADVTGAAHAQYAGLYDAKNAAFLGSGVVWDRSAVHAEVMSYVRTLFDQKGIKHQPAMWVKGQKYSSGGTVLPFFTRHGMNGLDVSIPLLSMHSPYEVISKADLYEAYRGYRAFLAD